MSGTPMQPCLCFSCHPSAQITRDDQSGRYQVVTDIDASTGAVENEVGF